jgi:ADP-heptose:LPS heptosyltransferase
VRHADPGDVPEAARGLSVAAAAGFHLPDEDDGLLAVRRQLPDSTHLTGGAAGSYVVLHPGTSVAARFWPPARWADTAALLAERHRRVVVTGSFAQRALTAPVAASGSIDLGGRTTLVQLAAVLDGAEAVVVANTTRTTSQHLGGPRRSLFR